jgi:hypothetical protein
VIPFSLASPAGPLAPPAEPLAPPARPDAPPARPDATPARPGPLPEGPVGMPDSPVGMPDSPVGLPAGANSPLAGPNVLPAGPDLLVPGPAVLVDPMLKLLTGPSPLLFVPVPLPLDVVLAPVWVVVVEWRVIDVADICIGPTPSGALGAEKGLPGAFGPWCVFASAVPAADKATHIAAAVTAPVITALRVQDRCWMLCLPTMSPLCNKYLEYAAVSGAIIRPKASKSTARNDRASRIVHHWLRGTSKSTHNARHTSRGSKPSSMACAAVRPPRLVSTWSASTDAPYAAPNC